MQRFRCLFVRPGQTWRVLFLANVAERRWLHWVAAENRSRPCMGSRRHDPEAPWPCKEGECQYRKQRPWFAGWAPVLGQELYFPAAGRPRGVGKPELLVAELWPAVLHELDGRELRGSVVHLVRPKGAGYAAPQRIEWEVSPWPKDQAVPPAFDVRPSLAWLWGEPDAFAGDEPAEGVLKLRKPGSA